jgi:putative transposase
MSDLSTGLACLRQCLDPTPLRQLGRRAEAMLSMTGRVTRQGIARWAGPGGSYRTVQRICPTSRSWGRLQWMVMRQPLWDQDEVMVRAGDDVIVTKAGKQTQGLGRFFSSLDGNKGPGLGFLRVSLLSVNRRPAYPVMMEQRAQPPTATPPAVAKPKSQGPRGRPPGSKKQHRREGVLSPYLGFVHETITRLLELIGDHGQVIYFVFDGAFGHHDALQMVRQVG